MEVRQKLATVPANEEILKKFRTSLELHPSTLSYNVG